MTTRRIGVPLRDAIEGGAYYPRHGRVRCRTWISPASALRVRAYLGGTFDPVHAGHLHAARSVASALGVGLVTLVLAARPPHRAARASASDRWEMLRLAVAGEATLAASDIELRREGLSYSIDTIELLGNGDPVVWIVGSDGLDTFATWHRFRSFSESCHIAVVVRPGTEVTPLPGFSRIEDPASLADRPHGCLFVLAGAMLDISASQIRRLLSRGGDASALLPSPVCAYIQEQGLYHR